MIEFEEGVNGKLDEIMSSSLKLFGLGAAGGTIGVLVLGMLIFSQLGKDFYAGVLGIGLIVFIIAGALAILGRSGMLRG